LAACKGSHPWAVRIGGDAIVSIDSLNVEEHARLSAIPFGSFSSILPASALY
jgi:hypothetical protein